MTADTIRNLLQWTVTPPRPIWRLALPVTAMGVLLALSSIPGEPAIAVGEGVFAVFHWIPPTVHNLLHVPAYALLAWLWRLGLGHGRNGTTTAVAAGVCAGFALLDEAYQSTIPGRYAAVTDLLLDFAGIAVGLVVFSLLRRRHAVHPCHRERL